MCFINPYHFFIHERKPNGYAHRTPIWQGNEYHLFRKIDLEGNNLITIEYELDEDDYEVYIHKGILTNDNKYIFCGGLRNDVSNSISCLKKTDSNGEIVFENNYGNPNETGFFNLIKTSDNGYLMVGGSSDSLTESIYTYIVKTNQFGNITSTFEIPLPNPNRKLEKTINLKGQEVKPQTNQPIIEIFDDGTTQKKIIIE